MPLSGDEIRRIAHLARLELSPDEEAEYAAQLGRVVEYIDQIESLEGMLESVEPETDTVSGAAREDRSEGTLPIEEFLENAPASLDRFLLVPQIK